MYSMKFFTINRSTHDNDDILKVIDSKLKVTDNIFRNALLWWRHRPTEDHRSSYCYYSSKSWTGKTSREHDENFLWDIWTLGTRWHQHHSPHSITSQSNTADSPTPFRCLCRWSSTGDDAASSHRHQRIVMRHRFRESHLPYIWPNKEKNDLKYCKCCRNKHAAKHREATVVNPVKQHSKINASLPRAVF